MSTGPLTVPEEFDDKTCVTAKQLRANGLQLPAEIPDAAWVKRSSIRYDLQNATTTYVEAEKRIDSCIPVHINEDFREPDKRSIAKVTICGLPTCGFEPTPTPKKA